MNQKELQNHSQLENAGTEWEQGKDENGQWVLSTRRI